MPIGAGRRFFRTIGFAIAALVLLAGTARAQPPQDQDQSGRVALVIGNAAYPARPLATAANDAGLVAEMVRNAGYDLVEARDVDETLLRQAVRQFLDKVAAAGPDAVAFVYLSGYGFQFEGDNYFAPVSARLARVTDIPTETLRVGDILRALDGMKVARVVVLDMSREHPFLGGARAVPPGLALVEPGEGALVAFSTGPGEVLRDSAGPYGLYAPALVEMATKPGLPLDQIFTQVRLRVHEASRGALTPWHLSRITAPVFFFEGEGTPDDAAPPPQAQLDPQAQQLLGRPLTALSPDQAYSVVLERDTIEAYQQFIAAFPDHALAKRVRLLLAERREALIWRRTVAANTPPAYWSYLRRYPRGPHAPEARRRLAALTAPAAPPPDFAMMDYDVPPPPPDEVEFFEDYYESYYAGPPPDYAPPPPFPVYLLPPIEREFVDLPPPAYYDGVVYLPVPGPIVIRRAIRPARPLFVFRGRQGGPRRDWRRPDAINRFGGQAPRTLRAQPANVQPRPVPLVQPASPAPDQQLQRRRFEEQQQRVPQQQQQQRTIEQQNQERALRERGVKDQQERALRERGAKEQQERALRERGAKEQQERALRERGAKEQQERVLRERGAKEQQERALRERGAKEQQERALRDRGAQEQRERALREQRERDRGAQQRAIQQQQQQQQQQRVIQQQQQQRAIQQQQQQRAAPPPQRAQPQPAPQPPRAAPPPPPPRAAPQPARPQPQKPACPKGAKPDGTCI
jgi:uncharacterized caspase-like protein